MLNGHGTGRFGAKPILPTTRFKPGDAINMPVSLIPVLRSTIAIQNGVEKNILLKCWGGLGDRICAEPTLRYALNNFKECRVSLAAENPELFAHLNFNRVFDLDEVTPNYANYLTLETITPPDDSNLVWQFFSHLLVNCVDFPSLCALRSQLPVKDRVVELHPTADHMAIAMGLLGSDLGPKDKLICVHPGRHWPSKTFPKDWWDDVLYGLRIGGYVPVLIGAETDDNRGTVTVEPEGCVDLRGKLKIMETVALLQAADVLLTNDSSPLHMAVTGEAHVLYIATCKHPDYITHYRRTGNGSVRWGWRMKNMGLGGTWDHISIVPNNKETITVENVPEDLLRSWLPTPLAILEEINARLVE